MMMACETPSTGVAADLANTMQRVIPVLETERLRLRAPRIGDFSCFADCVLGARGRFFLENATREKAWYDFTQLIAGWVLHGHGPWTVETKVDDKVAGFVLLGFEPGDTEPELGYIFTDAAEGQGFATEAAIAARNFAFGTLCWSTLVSCIAPGNSRSIALAERLGAKLDGQIDDAEDSSTTLIYRHPVPAPTELPTQTRYDASVNATPVLPVSEDQNV